MLGACRRLRSVVSVAQNRSSQLNIDTFQVTPEEARQLQPSNAGPIHNLFLDMPSGRGVQKWLHYLPVYDRALAPYRDCAVMLEIGVCYGGSLDMWRRYFGTDATIFGIDVNPECASRVAEPNQVRIGSQADPEFLMSVVSEMGRPNIILDDGSHYGPHQFASFKTLWPQLQTGGVYIIEDLHTSYWPEMDGGVRRAGTGVDLVKTLMDDMHGWYHQEPPILADKSEVGAIHFYDSIVVIEKVVRPPPAQLYMGG